jgi:two-component system response regulator YesN
VFAKLKEELDDCRSHAKKQEETDKLLSQLIEYSGSQFIDDLIFGVLRSPAEIDRRLSVMGISASGIKCAVLNIMVPDYKNFINEKWFYGEDALYTAIANLLRFDADSIFYLSSQGRNGEIKALAFYKGTNPELFETALNENNSRIFSAVREVMGIECEITVENKYNNIYEINDKNIEVKPGEIGAEQIKRGWERQKLLLTHINYGNTAAVKNLFLQISGELANTDIKRVREYLVNVISVIINKLSEMDLQNYGKISELVNYSEIFNAKSPNSALQAAVETVCRITEYVSDKFDIGDSAVVKAKNYIDKNYDKDITLFSAANHVFLSPAYFSRLFKEKVGETFINYLVKARLEHAVELLKSGNYKVYEISEIVGYKSAKYFYRLFKKYYGVTPNEYRNSI